MQTVEVSAMYVADEAAEAVLTLVTTAARRSQDMRVFETLARNARICTIIWHDAKGHRQVEGSGRPCPAHGDFY